MKSIKTAMALVMCLALVACNQRAMTMPIEATKMSLTTIKVGFSQMENNGPWRIAETNSILSEAKLRRVELIYTDAKGSIEKQIEDVRYLLDQDIDYLLLAPKKYEELAVVLDMAKEKNVKVILVDRSVKGVAGVDYLTLIISNNVWEAEQAGYLLEEATNGKAQIVELTGTIGSSSAEERTRGFMNVIKRYPDMEIIASESADFSRAEGKKVMESIIRDHKDEITAVYAHNDEMAIGAIMALKAVGIEPGEDVIVISVDGEKDALKAIIAGDLYATIECTPIFGPKIFDVIEKDLQGEKLETLYINEDRIFTIDNALDHIDEAF